MINKKRVRSYCSEDISLIENYDKAIADTTQIWHCHHRREIDENKSTKELVDEGLYYKRPAYELIFLTPSEHRSLHMKGEKNPFFKKQHSIETREKLSVMRRGKKLSAETREKMSEAQKGGKNHFFGKQHSDETKDKIRNAIKGCHFWNNGVEMKYCKECPGPEWKLGMIKKKK